VDNGLSHCPRRCGPRHRLPSGTPKRRFFLCVGIKLTTTRITPWWSGQKTKRGEVGSN